MKMKMYYRNEAGEFISKKEWFKRNDYFSLNRAISFHHNPQGEEKYIKAQNMAVLAICGATRIIETYSDNFSLSIRENGELYINMGTFLNCENEKLRRENMLRGAFTSIADIKKHNEEFIDSMNSTFIEYNI